MGWMRINRGAQGKLRGSRFLTMSENHWPESSGDVKETAEQRKPVRLGWSFPVNLLKAGLDTELKARA